MSDLTLHPVDDASRPAAERMWQLFRHDMSAVDGELPGPDGAFRRERLEAALTDPGWAAHVVFRGDRSVGLVVVRGLDGPVRVVNGFFVVRAARRSGTGLAAFRALVATRPGPWSVPFQDANTAAVAFWRRAATAVVGEDWTEERRPVPGRPDLPPDVWISFDTTR